MSPNTLRNYRVTFAKLQAFVDDDPPFPTITRELRDEYLGEPDGAAPRGQIKLAPKTILNLDLSNQNTSYTAEQIASQSCRCATHGSRICVAYCRVVEIDTHGGEPHVNLGGAPPHVIIRLYSVLKTRLCDGLQRTIGDHTAQEEKQTTRLLKSASRHSFWFLVGMGEQEIMGFADICFAIVRLTAR